MINSKHDIIMLLEEIGIYTTRDRIEDFVSFFQTLEQQHGRNKLLYTLKTFCSDENATHAFLIALSGNPFYGFILDELHTILNKTDS